MSWLMWFPAVAGATGVGLLAYLSLGAAVELLRRGSTRRRRVLESLNKLLHERADQDKVTRVSEEELYGLPSNLAPWMLLVGLAGLGITSFMLVGPLRVLGIAAGLLPLFWKNRRLQQGRLHTQREVLHFIEEMRLQLAFGGSLGAVLNNLAGDKKEGVLYERLRAHRQVIVIDGPEAVLARLADDLRSGELNMLLRRVRAARKGGLSYVDALKSAAAEVVQEVHRRAELEVEGAPLGLMLPMLALVFPPVLVLLLYPPAAALIQQVTGPGVGLGF